MSNIADTNDAIVTYNMNIKKITAIAVPNDFNSLSYFSTKS